MTSLSPPSAGDVRYKNRDEVRLQSKIVYGTGTIRQNFCESVIESDTVILEFVAVIGLYDNSRSGMLRVK